MVPRPIIARLIGSYVTGTYMQLDPEALRIIVNNRPMVRLLMIIDEADGCPTRMLLKRLGSNDLHPLLVKAEMTDIFKEKNRNPFSQYCWATLLSPIRPTTL